MTIKTIDMMLKEGRYEIPDDLRMYIEPGARTLVVKKREDRRIRPGDLRCADCKHRGKGYLHPGWHYGCKDDVCLLRVKKVVDGVTYYYGAPYNKRPCSSFEPKEAEALVRAVINDVDYLMKANKARLPYTLHK